MIPFNAEALDWLARSSNIAADALRITPMRGANSSAVFAIETAHKPRAQRFVLRVFNDKEWLAQEPDLLIHETFALAEARYCNVATPALIASKGDDIGFGGPVILMSRVRGHVELRPADLQDWTTKLAGALVQIHAREARDFGWHYSQWFDSARLQVPNWATDSQLWERAIAFYRTAPPLERDVFLHRDFHPCNVLWRNGKVSGVVDWVNACRGPRGLDVAHCRTNLAVLFGVETADAFRNAYIERAGGAHHSYWDVCSILEFSLPEPEYYRPWSEFGVEAFGAREMGRRLEIYLQSVMARVSN